MATQTQTVSGQSEERLNLVALDAVEGHTERAVRERLIVQRAELDHKQRIAKAFAISGCFADINGQTPEQGIARALVKMALGESMGFSPAESMTGIDIIQGRLAVGANLRAARMQRAGFAWPAMILTENGCWLPLEYKGQPLLRQKVSQKGELQFDGEGQPTREQVIVSFTAEDAKAAGLHGKDNYKKNPRNMYFARAVTNAQRWYAPGVLGLDILSVEEAREIPAEPIRATISLDQIRPSADQNRGHDDTFQIKKDDAEKVVSLDEERDMFNSIRDRKKLFGQLQAKLGEDNYREIVNAHGGALNFECYRDLNAAVLAAEEQAQD